MPKYRGTDNYSEAGVLVVELDKIYEYSEEDQEYVDWLNRNVPGCLVLVEGEERMGGAPVNRMMTGAHLENRAAGPVLPQTADATPPKPANDEGPVSTMGQNSGDDWNLMPVDATAGAIALANETGFNLGELQRKLDRRVTKADVENALKSKSEEGDE